MMRSYSFEQAAQKLGLDDAEIRFLAHHFREFLSMPVEGQPQRGLTDPDILLLARVYKLHNEQGMDPGDIRSLLRDEAQGQSSGRRQAEVLAVVGGRPGVGKSSIVLNLAAALNARGYRCAIFDGAYDGGGLWSMLRDKVPVDAWEHTLESGVRVISGEGYLQAQGDTTDVLPGERLVQIESACDYIIVDSGNGGSDTALRFAMAVDETVLVTMPDVGANAECFSIIRMLKDIDPDMRVGLVINRAAGIGEARESFARIHGAARKLNIGELPGLGWLAEDESLRKYFADGETVVDALPTSTSARCIARLADHLVNRLSPVDRRSRGLEGLLQALRNALERGGRSVTII